jgi:hypothetical protein
MKCETCRDSGFPGMILRAYSPPRGVNLSSVPIWKFVHCPDCIGGVASCCDMAGANQAHILDAAEQVNASER